MHIHASCDAPLIRFKASSKLRHLSNGRPDPHYGMLVSIAATLFAAALPGGIRAAVFMIAAALLAFSTTDVIQETFAMRARRHRSDAIIGGPKAQRLRAVLLLEAGLTCLMLSFMGFLIWASITTEM